MLDRKRYVHQQEKPLQIDKLATVWQGLPDADQERKEVWLERTREETASRVYLSNRALGLRAPPQ